MKKETMKVNKKKTPKNEMQKYKTKFIDESGIRTHAYF